MVDWDANLLGVPNTRQHSGLLCPEMSVLRYFTYTDYILNIIMR